MSIATDVSRIKGNITAALAAIADKGVTVPDGSTSDALAALIASIEAGGGDTSNIIFGSFTLTEVLPSSTPMYIDIQFPSQSFPLMYAVYEDTSEYSYNDKSHTSDRLRTLISVRTNERFFAQYYCQVTYNSSASDSVKTLVKASNYTDNSYANSGGYYGLFEVSLAESKVRIKNMNDGVPFLQGRTYYYVLYWG